MTFKNKRTGDFEKQKVVPFTKKFLKSDIPNENVMNNNEVMNYLKSIEYTMKDFKQMISMDIEILTRKIDMSCKQLDIVHEQLNHINRIVNTNTESINKMCHKSPLTKSKIDCTSGDRIDNYKNVKFYQDNPFEKIKRKSRKINKDWNNYQNDVTIESCDVQYDDLDKTGDNIMPPSFSLFPKNSLLGDLLGKSKGVIFKDKDEKSDDKNTENIPSVCIRPIDVNFMGDGMTNNMSSSPISLLSILSNLIENDKKEKCKNDDDIVEDVLTPYASEDEFEELDIQINNLDDLIDLGDLYTDLSIENPNPENKEEINTSKQSCPIKSVKLVDIPDNKMKKKSCYELSGKKYSVDLKKINELKVPLGKLKNMIGLSLVKSDIVDMVMYYLQYFEKQNNSMLHTIIEGKPGVGKTELGKILAEIYANLGIIKSNKIKYVRRTDLVGEYLGHTAHKTQKAIDEADGGVLFIDEAYALGNEDKKDSFAKECIDTLNQNLSENRKKFICIIAGYPDQLDKCFFSYNPGLKRRFPFVFKIDDYNPDELRDIFIKKIKDNNFKLDEQEMDINRLTKFFQENKDEFPHFGGDVENLFINCKFMHSKRVFGKHPKHRRRFTKLDIDSGMNRFIANKKKKPEEHLNYYM